MTNQHRADRQIGLGMGLLLAILILALAACGGQTDEGGTPQVESGAGQAEATATTAPATETPPEPALEPMATESVPEPVTAAPTSEPTATAEASAEAAPPAVEETPTPPVVEAQVSAVTLAPVASGFSRPLYLTHAFDERLFVVEQAGQVKIIADGQTAAAPFLDIRDRVGSTALEQGLLSIAFHPQYEENGLFYVNYTDLQGDTVVAEFAVDAADPNRADPASERILLTVDQPYGNHNGGQLQFGPDGYLYVGMGDGGSAGDPLNQGQDANSLLGALLRLDVGTTGSLPYGIPADNPFAGTDDGRDEVWATGLRNPWRFSFDRETGDLYVADVGQSTWEEVNFQAADAPGGANYGWNVLEASTCYATAGCDPSRFVAPVAEYAHQDGNCSVSGGYVYRGSSFPAMTGNYFFADYCSGTIWSLFQEAGSGWQTQLLQRSGLIISSFGEDWRGELYIIDIVNGDIYQLQS